MNPSVLAILLASAVPLVLAACGHPPRERKELRVEEASLAPRGVSGRVVGLSGAPVAGARVETPQGNVTTDSEGRFTTQPAQGPRWVTVSRAGYVKRARVGLPERELLVRLTDDPNGEVVTLAFAGDTMFGRRFYDPNEDGAPDDGLVRPGTEARDFPLFLRDAKPFLELPDLMALNYESALLNTDSVYLFKRKGRDPVFHPTKAFAYASRPESIDALRVAGVDILGLANNHVYDALDFGVAVTQAELTAKGFGKGTGSFGLGSIAEEAWIPAIAVAKARGGSKMRVAYLGCTTIRGAKHAIDYVASATKGGAAPCDKEAIATAVKAARAKSDLVVFMVHGGQEYSRTATGPVQEATSAALAAGAKLVVNHHPHVVGGFTRPAPDALVAWSMGNFLFDQTVWPTFESYILFVQYKAGKLLRAYVEPLAVGGFQPHPVAGGMADFVASGAAGRVPGGFLVENGAVELVPSAVVETKSTTVTPTNFVKNGTAVLDNALSVPNSALRVGRDLLWVGRFENEILGLGSPGGPFWLFDGPSREISSRHAGEGRFGAAIWREVGDALDVVLTPEHRFLTEPAGDVTIIGRARTNAPGAFSAEISWYKDTKGESYRRDVFAAIVPADGSWHEFRIDAKVPADISNASSLVPSGDDEEGTDALVPAKPALGVYFRLKHQNAKERRIAAIDDVRVIDWAPAGTKPTLEHTHSLQPAGRNVLLVRQCQAGGC